jgi:hypothetical protein
MRVILLASVSASVAVVVLAGCDLFGIPCNDDDDCPNDVPFCAAGVCAADDDGRRAGNEGEGESDACTVDADCQDTGALCYDLAESAAHFDAARVDTCVPAANEDTSCAEAVALFSTSSGQQVIFGARVQRIAGDCTPGEDNLSIEVSYLDRGGFGPQTSGIIFTAPPGATSPNFVSAEISADGTSGILFGIDRGCYGPATTTVAIAIGQSDASSNGLCLPILAATPAP